MNRFLFATLAALFLLGGAGKVMAAPASFSAARSLVTASSSPGNLYVAGFSNIITAPVSGDLSAVGGNVISTALIKGDALFLGGSVDSREEIKGDLRAIGGNITVEQSVGGDLVASGLSVNDTGRAGKSVFIIALNTVLSNGASGPVTIYGNNVSLGGDFTGDVNVVASGRVTIQPDTIIHGAFSYESPETISMPDSAVVKGATTYTNISYLPNSGTSRAIEIASVGFFLLLRILGALIIAGLLAGLFPRLGELVAKRAYTTRLRSLFLTLLLGFAVLVATPIMLLILSLTFVGFGIALLLFIIYALLVFLAVIYAGIIIGGIIARRFRHRRMILWHDGVLGMLILSIIALIPYVGVFIALILTIFSIGALLLIFFHFAFPHGEQIELL